MIWMISLVMFLAQLQAAPRPAEYTVRLKTSKGHIAIAFHRDWAPNGADRVHELVTSGYPVVV